MPLLNRCQDRDTNVMFRKKIIVICLSVKYLGALINSNWNYHIDYSCYEKKFINTRWLNDYSWLKRHSEKETLCELQNCKAAINFYEYGVLYR